MRGSMNKHKRAAEASPFKSRTGVWVCGCSFSPALVSFGRTGVMQPLCLNRKKVRRMVTPPPPPLRVSQQIPQGKT